jgi:octopine/nopaline transport system permease protein
MGNVWQVVLKESALVSITGVAELIRQAQVGAGSTGMPFNFYIVAGAIYLLISTVSGAFLQSSERYFSKGTRRQ